MSIPCSLTSAWSDSAAPPARGQRDSSIRYRSVLDRYNPGVHRKQTPQVGARSAGQGRARDGAIDARILAAAKRQLAVLGYEGMSIAAVAQEAGTTRQALYRRWPSKADLAAAVVA